MRRALSVAGGRSLEARSARVVGAAPGCSSRAMAPPARRQPTVASQVRGDTTGLGSHDACRASRHPPNQAPELRGSTPGAAEVLPKVQQNVDQAAPRLGGCAERARVIATAPDAAAPADGPIDGLGAASGQALHAPHEGHRMIALDDEVNVIALDREVDDAEGGLV